MSTLGPESLTTLRELKALHTEGVLSDTEFKEQKQAILARVAPRSRLKFAAFVALCLINGILMVLFDHFYLLPSKLAASSSSLSESAALLESPSRPSKQILLTPTATLKGQSSGAAATPGSSSSTTLRGQTSNLRAAATPRSSSSSSDQSDSSIKRAPGISSSSAPSNSQSISSASGSSLTKSPSRARQQSVLSKTAITDSLSRTSAQPKLISSASESVALPKSPSREPIVFSKTVRLKGQTSSAAATPSSSSSRSSDQPKSMSAASQQKHPASQGSEAAQAETVSSPSKLLVAHDATQVKRQSPNVLVIITDDQGSVDMGAFGSDDLRTPSMDALAAAGIRFTQHYSGSAYCSPSRACLLTGRSPRAAGVIGNFNRHTNRGLAQKQVTIAEVFKAAGYRTALFGKWHLGHAKGSTPDKQGFDHWFGFVGGYIDNYEHKSFGKERPHDMWRNGNEVFKQGEYFPDIMGAEARQFVHDNRNNPFFVYYAVNLPHYPYQPDATILKEYRQRGVPHPRDLYGAALTTIDYNIGQLLSEIKTLNLTRDTIVVFQSDHGHSVEDRAQGGGGSAGPYRGHKGTLFEGGIRTPAIISWPGHIPQGEVRDQVVWSGDWLPTLVELCNLPPLKRRIGGHSLVPLLLDAGHPSPHQVLYWDAPPGGTTWAVRQGSWKLIFDRHQKHGPDANFLVNLTEDVGEKVNLAEQNPTIVRDLTTLHRNFVNSLGFASSQKGWSGGYTTVMPAQPPPPTAAKELPPAPAVSLSAPRSTAAPTPPIAAPSPSQPAPKHPTRSQSRSGDHQIPSVEQYAVLKYFRTDYSEALSAKDVAKSLQAAIDRDCQNSDVSCLLPDPSASSPSAASVAATMRALASFLNSMFVPKMMLALESLDDELPGRVASLARALLHGVLPWLPKVPRHSSDWPTTFSDLLPPTLRPKLKSKGVVMCVTAETREAVRSLIYNLRMSLVAQLPIEIFYVDDQDAPTDWRGTLKPYKSITFRSLKATFRHVSDSELCRPLAALATRFQQFVLLDSRVVVLRSPAYWFFHPSLQPTGPGALFFRDRFLTGNGFPNPYSYFVSMQPRKLSPKHSHFEKDFSHLHHIQDASAVVLDRSRADLGVVGVVALVGHPSTSEAARKAFPGTGEMWWIGFELLRAQFDFSFWLGGSIGRYVEIPEPGRSRPQTFVCGKMVQFDDTGRALYWTDGLDFPVCSGAGVQDRYWTKTERDRLRDGAPMIRPSAYDPETVEYRELSCGWCARIRHPGSLAVAVGRAGRLYMDVLARQQSRPPAHQALVGPSKQISAQFPSKHQLQALQLTEFSPAEIGKAAEADCQHGSNAPCSKLKLSRRAYAATPTVHDLGASMRSFQRFAASLFEPDMKIKLAAVRPSLPEEAAALTRNIMHALCPWLPNPDKGLGTWPSGPMDLFPEVLHPSAGRGVVACVGSRILPHFLVVLRTLRFQFQSDIPVELFYFDDNDLKPSDREMLRANYTNVYFSSLEDAFPRLLAGGFTKGWDCKVFAALASRFREVALLDSDLVLLREPAALFELPGFSEHGAAFFRDRNVESKGTNPFDVFLTALPGGTNDIQPAADQLKHLQDSSVVVLDRVRVIMGLFGTASLMGHDQVREETQRSCLGDKELFWIGFSMMNVGYTFSPWLAGSLGEVRGDAGVCGHMVQFDKAGNILFWNSGFAKCDHREARFSPHVVLRIKHLLRRKTSDLSLSHEYVDKCGWCSKESRPEPPPSSAPEDVAPEIAMVAQNVTSLAQEVFRAYGLMPPPRKPKRTAKPSPHKAKPPTDSATEPPTQSPTEAPPTAPSTDSPTPAVTAQAIVVLGQSLNPDGSVPPTLLERAKFASFLHHERLIPLIVTGGDPQNTGTSEAQVMFQLCTERFSVPQDHVILEDQSRSTVQNAWNVLDILQHRGWTSFLLVTSDFHLPRATLYFESVFAHRGAGHIHIEKQPSPSGLPKHGKRTSINAMGLVERLELEKDMMKKSWKHHLKSHMHVPITPPPKSRVAETLDELRTMLAAVVADDRDGRSDHR